MRTLIRGAQVLTMNPDRPIIPEGAVLMEGDRIVAVDTYEALKQSPGVEQHWGDADTWILPGFVNAHYHHDRVFGMGGADAPLELWLLRGSGLEAPAPEVEDEFNHLNALVSAIQLARSGITTTMDMAWPSNHRPVIQAYLDLGLDLIYAPTLRSQNGYVYESDDRFLKTLPDDLRQRIAGQGLGLTGIYFPAPAYFDTWSELHTAYADRIQLVIAPDGPEWCSEDELREAARRAASVGACLHLHNTESPMERQWPLQTRKQTMCEYLDSIGFLGSRLSCGHGVWYSDHDIELLAAKGVVTVHNPSSNLRLANGVAPVAAYMRGGMTVALGTDGQGLTETSNFFEEMRLAAYLQRIPSSTHPAPDPWTRGLPARTVFEMATVNGARAFRREGLGRLKAGYRADLLLLNAKRMSAPYLWPGHDPYAAVLQKAQPEHLDKVVSRGRVLVEHGQVLTVDEAQGHPPAALALRGDVEGRGREADGPDPRARALLLPLLPALAGARHASPLVRRLGLLRPGGGATECMAQATELARPEHCLKALVTRFPETVISQGSPLEMASGRPAILGQTTREVTVSVTIAKSEVGYFTSLAKKRAYDGARSVMRQCDHLAAEAASLDNHQTYDANKNAGFVLLDGGHSRHLSFMQGTCQYAGDQVQSLDLEAIEYRKDANNIDRQHKVQAQLSRTPEVTRYATPEGLVLVDNATGTLTYSTENGIQPSDR